MKTFINTFRVTHFNIIEYIDNKGAEKYINYVYNNKANLRDLIAAAG